MNFKQFQVDQGYAWVIVFAAFLLQVISIGITFTFGVLYIEILNVYKADKSTTAWIGSVQSFFTYFTGVFAASIVKQFGWRTTTITGSLISCFGFILSSFVTSMYPLFFTYGVLIGFGNGLMYFSSIVSVQHYFNKRRSLATGITVSGSGIGMFFFGMVTSKLIEKYQLKGVFLFQGFIVLIGVICGLLLRPIEHQGTGSEQEEFLIYLKTTPDLTFKQKFYNIVKDILDFSILNNLKFSIFMASFFIYAFGLYSAFTYIPYMAKMEYNVSEEKASFLISIMGIVNVCCRILFALIGDMGEKIRFYLVAFQLFGSGLVCVFMHFVNSFTGIGVMMAVYGGLSGSSVLLFSVILVDIVNVKDIEKSIGIVCTICSLVMLVSSPLGGWILDYTNDFHVLFYVIGFWQIYSSCLYMCMHLIKDDYKESVDEILLPIDHYSYIPNRNSILRMSF